MKLDQIRIPLHLAPLLGEVYSFKIIKNEVSGENEFLIPESWLVQVVQIAAGTGSEKMNIDELENESPLKETKESFSGSFFVKQSDVNQYFNPYLPQEIIEVMQEQDCNPVRAIQIVKGLSLKEVAQRYGGTSAAANIANIMARPTRELASLRPSTLARLAEALDCPVSWLEVKLPPSDLFSPKGDS